jgi:hypothetical protein
MRTRLGLSIGVGSILALAVASTAFASHCSPVSKPNGAGQQLIVLIDPVTHTATFQGTNAAGRLTGGFADVYPTSTAPGPSPRATSSSRTTSS